MPFDQQRLAEADHQIHRRRQRPIQHVSRCFEAADYGVDVAHILRIRWSLPERGEWSGRWPIPTTRAALHRLGRTFGFGFRDSSASAGIASTNCLKITSETSVIMRAPNCARIPTTLTSETVETRVPPSVERLKRAGHLHRRAAFAAHILAFPVELDRRAPARQAGRFSLRPCNSVKLGPTLTLMAPLNVRSSTVSVIFAPGTQLTTFLGSLSKAQTLSIGSGDLEGLFNAYCHIYVIPFSWRICHTFHGVIGISMWRTPRCERASTTALTNAAGDPTLGDSPTPFAPMG